MFWIEDSSLIKRANLDGSDVVTIATMTNPVAIAIDVVLLNLYWISDVNRITRSSFNGSDQEVIYQGGQGSVFTDLTVFEDYVYIVTNDNYVIRIYKFTSDGTVNTTLLYTASPIADIHIVHSLQQPVNLSGKHVCIVYN